MRKRYLHTSIAVAGALLMAFALLLTGCGPGPKVTVKAMGYGDNSN